MTIVIISSKYQVVIPKDIRHSLNLKSGQKMQMFQLGERIVLIPQKNIKAGRGILKGINPGVKKERDRF